MARLARWLLCGLLGALTLSMMMLFAPPPGLQQHELKRAARAEAQTTAFFDYLQDSPPAAAVDLEQLSIFDSSAAPSPAPSRPALPADVPSRDRVVAVDFAAPDTSARLSNAVASPRSGPYLSVLVRHGHQWIVHPGQRIQDAIDQALPGDTVWVEPGVYHEALVLNRSDLTLLGVERSGARPVLDGRGVLPHGITGVGHRLEIGRFTIRHYTAEGVRMHRGVGLSLHHLTLTNTGLYGLHVAEGFDVRITQASVTGARAAGLYMRDTKQVHVLNSTVQRNRLGIILENTMGAHVAYNTVSYNAGGLAVSLQPGSGSSKASCRTRIHHNRIHDNNMTRHRPVWRAARSRPAERAAEGTGVLIAAADEVTVHDNTISNNNAAGIRVLGLATLYDPGRTFSVDPVPDNLRVHSNLLINNGLTLPAATAAIPAAHTGETVELPGSPVAEAGVLSGADLVWDLSGASNGWDQPHATRYPRTLPHAEWGLMRYRANQRFWSFVDWVF